MSVSSAEIINFIYNPEDTLFYCLLQYKEILLLSTKINFKIFFFFFLILFMIINITSLFFLSILYY